MQYEALFYGFIVTSKKSFECKNSRFPFVIVILQQAITRSKIRIKL